MSTTIADEDLQSEVFILRRPPLAERIALVNELNMLEGQLFDGASGVRGGARNERAQELLNVVNSLRHRLGWLPIDDHHGRGWPEKLVDIPELVRKRRRLRPRFERQWPCLSPCWVGGCGPRLWSRRRWVVVLWAG